MKWVMHLPGYQNIQIQAFSIGVTSFPLSEGKKQKDGNEPELD